MADSSTTGSHDLGRGLHVLMVNYGYGTDLAGPEELLERHPTIAGWGEALSSAGARVTALLRFREDSRIDRGAATYHFVGDPFPPLPRAWQVPTRLHRLARSLGASVVHLNGLLFPVQSMALRSVLPAGCPLVGQHHAERPWRGPRRILQRRGLRAFDGFFFAARGLGRPWTDRRLIRESQPVFEIMEASTRFRRLDRQSARALTKLAGEPVCLWVGRLDRNKDPLTVLSGFRKLLNDRPAARLYMAFGTEELLPQVRTLLSGDALLKTAVTLLGRLTHPDMEHYYNSADYLLLGSRYEGSGYALVEALACGVVPVVTDIPPFRVNTDGGAIGAVWQPGNADALADALREVLRRPLAKEMDAARRFFETRLSYPAIAARALAAYRDLMDRRRSRV